MKITASIVTYNNAETIEKCIDSILRETEKKNYKFRLYIYDNASSDITPEILSTYSDRVKVIYSDANRGFGYGHNYIIRRVRSDIHFVVNPDIYIDEDVFGQMAEYLTDNPDTGLITPKILSNDGSIQPIPKYGPSIRFSFIGNLPGFKWLRRKYSRTDENLSDATDIEFCTGCFFGAKTGYLKEVHGFSPEYFIYCEDSDLSKKVLADNKRIIYYPYVNAYHNWSRDNTHHLKGFAMFIRSLIIYFNKWGWKF
ncbi:MAG: glycosyltransferase family 2 protein [Eubacterium sp.]|nr:glycosyltransferase family 2 protein [Eubacterium sp.]